MYQQLMYVPRRVSVADRSPMRRGLKGEVFWSAVESTGCCRPLPDEEGTESQPRTLCTPPKRLLQTAPR